MANQNSKIITEYFPQIDAEALLKDVETFYQLLAGYIEAISKFNLTTNRKLLSVIIFSILKRQHRTVGVIINLVKSKQGYEASVLLRPCCEQLLWQKYLLSIDNELAEQIAHCFSTVEMHRSVEAQEKFFKSDSRFSSSAMQQMGISAEYINWLQRTNELALQKLRSIGEQLKWNLKQNQDRPSVWYIAKKTNSEAMYKYLYHATSRSVHFSVHDILRNVWGPFDNMAFEPTYFDKYWSIFSLYWSWSLLKESFLKHPPEWVDFNFKEVKSVEEFDLEVLQEISTRLNSFPPPPIITSAELNYPK